ncbi:actin interacting protein 3-domain-containing protein [Corynascus similis CBS 632.67]
MTSSRSSHRRSPGAEPGPPPSVPPRSVSPAVGVGTNRPVAPRSTGSSRSVQPTSASGSGSRSDGTRRANSSGSSTSVPLSQIEKSVTHLLVATKQLLETLTQWSRGNATDTQVSDVYVRLGYEFNMACRAFTAINVDTSDLGNVPELLRNILEATLSQEASAESLERYLPKIRDIIISLLHGLKRKQTRLRQRQQRERDSAPPGTGSGESADATSPPVPARTTSTSTMGSAGSGLTTLLNEGLEDAYRPGSQRDDGRSNAAPSPTKRFLQREQSRGSANSDQSSLSSNTMQNAPVPPPYPGDETIPSGPSASELSSLDNFPPPPPPPKASQQSALAALQRGGDLERRASRRYSAYQISKHLGAQAPGIPMLPPQTTPIPNRGRGEVRESMRAMQARDTVRHKRNMSSQSRTTAPDSSPVRVPTRVSEEPEEPRAELPTTGAEFPGARDDDKFQPSATLNGPPPDVMPFMEADDGERGKPATSGPAPVSAPIPSVARATTPDKPPSTFTETPPATKELTLFLQYKSKVKKFVLPGGYEELSIGRLQLAFIEKFSWNTQQNGADLPDIYIQDPVSGVRHELEDLSDIKDRTVLVLNVEQLDEVKRHIDDGLGSIRQMMMEMKQNVDDHGAALQRVSERQQETAKEMARLAAAPPTVVAAPVESPKQAGPMSASRRLNPAQLTEVQSLRRDLAVLRQTYSNFQSEIQGSMSALRSKAANVKVAAAKMAVPDIEGDTGHSYVINGRKKLNSDSDRIVNKVDDLQDLVEDLRKDVVHRGVRPLPRQLEAVTRDITTLTKELSKMEEYMKQEKPIWTKIWEKELEEVCQGRDELRLVEDLIVDLRDDLEKASETFALVEQATKEQMKDAGPGGVGGGIVARQFSKGLNSIRENAALADPTAAKEGVLGEVRALQPNHENRLEAIERAEKLRQKELERRRENPLTKEIATFVEEGKLKKSGGVEEVERARKAKDERIRREVWERQNGIVVLPEEPAEAVGEQDEGGEEEQVNGTANAPGAE